MKRCVITATVLVAVAIGATGSAQSARAANVTAYSVRGIHVDVVQSDPPPVGRIILLHGLYGDADQMVDLEPFATLTSELAAHGWQVVIPDLPYVGPSMAARIYDAVVADGGVSYVRLWRIEFREIRQWAAKTFGPSRLVVGGISWGGWHALEAACFARGLVGWFAHMPVVETSLLAELASVPAPAMSLSGCGSHINTPGYLAYGTADTRVGWMPTAALGQQLVRRGVPVTVRAWAGEQHETNLANVADMVDWLDGLRR